MRRILLAVALLTAMPAAAQQQPPAKEDAAKALKALQEQIDLTRKQRLELEAQAERALSADVSERAKRLAMGGEAGALQQLEFLLDSAQARLLVQRDRIRLLKDASATNQQAAVVVVLFRADTLPPGEVSTVIWMDAKAARSVTFTAERARNVVAGAAEEVYRAEIAPVGHTVLLQFAARGLVVGDTIAIPAAPNQVTYVEFVIKNGKMTAGTWTSRATSF